MTPKDYENEKNIRQKNALNDFSKGKILNPLNNIILIIIIIFIWYYYNYEILYIIAWFISIIWAEDIWNINWYKKWFSYWYDEWYEVMQEKSENELN